MKNIKKKRRKSNFGKERRTKGGGTEGGEQDDGKEGCVIYRVDKLGGGSR